MSNDVTVFQSGAVVPAGPGERRLTAQEFHALAEMPPEALWLANITNPNTRRAYQNDLKEFMRFAGIERPEEFRMVTAAHLTAWREDLKRRELAGASIRRKLAAVSSLLDYLCDAHAITHNPALGVTRPKVDPEHGKTPALSDPQARALLDRPPADTLKGLRDRAILSVFLYHGLRREEVCRLLVRDRYVDRGVTFLRIRGKGDKTRLIPLHPETAQWLSDYLSRMDHAGNHDACLFQSMRGTGSLTPDGIYISVVRKYALEAGIDLKRYCHALRATAATNALEHGAEITKVQDWLGHANVSTTRVYDKREQRPQDSPTFKVSY